MKRRAIKRYEMMETWENLDWCRPYWSKDGTCAVILNSGEIDAIMVDGEDFVNPSREQLIALAARLNPDDADPDADGEELIEILLDDMQMVGCADCPYCDECEAMEMKCDSCRECRNCEFCDECEDYADMCDGCPCRGECEDAV
nr:MAG TPA: hypothetical protein [Caudoviricetes sp.]